MFIKNAIYLTGFDYNIILMAPPPPPLTRADVKDIYPGVFVKVGLGTGQLIIHSDPVAY